MSAMRESFQNGSVERKARKRGPDVWVFRYKDGGKYISRRIGTVEKYRSKAAAEKGAVKFREEINEQIDCLTIKALCGKFKKEELDARPDTKATYHSWLKRVETDLGHYRTVDIPKNLPAIEDWLNGLQKYKKQEPLSKRSKQHAQAFLHLLIEYAMKHGHHPLVRNPIQLLKVKGAHIRVRVHTLLTGAQFHALMADPELPEHVRVIIQICMLLGLRMSEVLGLKWEAIDFEKHTIRIERSVTGKHSAETKTPASTAVLPMHGDIETVFEGWRKINTAEDGADLSVNGWLFGNVITGRPFWRGIMQQDYLIPAGKRLEKSLGPQFRIESLGWHDFRHTYRAMMGELDVPLEMQQKLMRHADIRTTISYGSQRTIDKLRREQAKVVEMFRKRA